MLNKSQPAGIQYLGISGFTDSCKQAVIQLLHSGTIIYDVKILTYEESNLRTHSLFLTIDNNAILIIKAGFSSGYPGEGPKGYSFVLNLLRKYTDNINEYIIPLNISERIDNSSLTTKDLEKIYQLKNVIPIRWVDSLSPQYEVENVFRAFPSTLPMSLIDERLSDIALNFSSNPDNAIFHAYRKLESIVSERTGLVFESNTKLFSKAFIGDDSPLYWKGVDIGEIKGRASLFTSTFMAYRNKRAHRVPKDQLNNDIREFLLINQLFILESEAVFRGPSILKASEV